MNKTSLRIAVCKENESFKHSTLWKSPWQKFCIENSLNYSLVNGYDSDIIEQLRSFDVLLWHFSGYLLEDMLVARSILYSAKNMGLKVFPDFADAWHFDDKIAETYLLQSCDAPIPESHMFFDRETAITWANTDARFPLVAKLRNGSGSHNVKLLNNRHEAVKYCRKMFGSGLKSSPSLFYKAGSNVKSTRSLKVLVSRAKRIPEFLNTLAKARQFPVEKGYVFFQEFIPNNGYDLKIVVVGDKLSFIARNIRKGDFRASGGGSLFYDRSLVTKNVIDSAFQTSNRLGFKCMGYDYVIDSATGSGKIVEISYGFSNEALMGAGGYFDRNGNWYETPLNAPEELLRNLINE